MLEGCRPQNGFFVGRFAEVWVDSEVLSFVHSLKLTANAPENRPKRPKRKRSYSNIFQPSIFRCYVSFREGRGTMRCI